MDMMSLRRRVLVNQNKLVSARGNPLTFNTPLTKPLKECVVRFSPKQEGSGIPSPDNVREIVGRNSVKLWQSGKNFFGGWQVASLLGYTESNIHEDENGRYVSIGTKNEVAFPEGIFKENTQYTFIVKSYANSPLNSVKNFRIHYTDGTVTDVSSPNWVGTVAVTTNASKTIRGISIINRSITRYFYFEESGFFEGVCTVDDFELYKGLNEITFTFPSTVGDNGVVYGGYVDAENGEVVAEYAKIQLSDLTWSYSSGWSNPPNTYCVFSSGFNGGALFDSYNTKPWVCNALPSATRNEAYTGSYRNSICFTFSGTLGKGLPTLRLPAESVSSIEEAVDYIANNNITVAYKLETPLHYSLTPQLIATLRGENVMWSDTNGDLTVRYWTR